MNVTEILNIAEVAARLYGVVKANVERADETWKAGDLATLKAILEPLHASNQKLGATLDAALAEAAKR